MTRLLNIITVLTILTITAGMIKSLTYAESFQTNEDGTIYRFYNQRTKNSHFYTIDSEIAEFVYNQSLPTGDWPGIFIQEIPSFKAVYKENESCLEGSPVYRYRNIKEGDTHFYAINQHEIDVVNTLYNDIFEKEELAFCAYEQHVANTIPVYRWLNRVTGDTHFYTANLDEKFFVDNSLPDVFQYEGVAFYAFPISINDTSSNESGTDGSGSGDTSTGGGTGTDGSSTSDTGNDTYSTDPSLVKFKSQFSDLQFEYSTNDFYIFSEFNDSYVYSHELKSNIDFPCSYKNFEERALFYSLNFVGELEFRSYCLESDSIPPVDPNNYLEEYYILTTNSGQEILVEIYTNELINSEYNYTISAYKKNYDENKEITYIDEVKIEIDFNNNTEKQEFINILNKILRSYIKSFPPTNTFIPIGENWIYKSGYSNLEITMFGPDSQNDTVSILKEQCGTEDFFNELIGLSSNTNGIGVYTSIKVKCVEGDVRDTFISKINSADNTYKLNFQSGEEVTVAYNFYDSGIYHYSVYHYIYDPLEDRTIYVDIRISNTWDYSLTPMVNSIIESFYSPI